MRHAKNRKGSETTGSRRFAISRDSGDNGDAGSEEEEGWPDSGERGTRGGLEGEPSSDVGVV